MKCIAHGCSSPEYYLCCISTARSELCCRNTEEVAQKAFVFAIRPLMEKVCQLLMVYKMFQVHNEKHSENIVVSFWPPYNLIHLLK